MRLATKLVAGNCCLFGGEITLLPFGNLKGESVMVLACIRTAQIYK